MAKYLISLFLVLVLFCPLIAQDRISGTVIDDVTDEPLVAANVLIKGTSVGTATDEEGRFFLNYSNNEGFTLQVFYMGYKMKEVVFEPGSGLANILVRMQEDVFKGQEVVVTGIASQISREIAPVSVGSVDATKLTDLNAYSDIAQLLNGKISGTKITSSSGNVGGGYRFDIRSGGGLNGDGQPVIYVDGIRIDNSEIETRYSKGGQEISMMASLNPSEIANIEILKGPAAAATYGTDGSNGVVLITTKKGQLVQGGKGYSINYNYKFGTNSQSYQYTKDDVVSYKAANSVFKDGDFVGHDLSISGGNKATKYFFTMGIQDEEGIMVNNFHNRKNMRLNVDAVASEQLNLSATIAMNQSELARPENDDNIYGWGGNTLLRPTPWGWLDSIEIAAAEENIDIKKMSGSFKATYRPFKNFSINGSIGAEHSNMNHYSYYPPWGDYLYTNGSKQLTDRFNTQFTYTWYAGYKYNILEGFTGNTKVGGQLFDQELRRNYLAIDSLSSDKLKDIGSANGEDFLDDYGENYATFRTAGLFLDNAFNFQDKLFIGASIRQDFASSLSPKAPNIIYPQANVAIRLDRFGLTPGLIDMAKIRLAYGETGQLPGSTQSTPLIWAAEQSGYGGGLTVSEIGNNKLEPERIKELEIGLDLGLFNRYKIEASYAKMNAENSIVGRNLAPSTGLVVTAFPDNIGKIEGHSFELGLDAVLVNEKNVRLEINQRNSWQKDEITIMPEPSYTNDIQVLMEGKSRWTFFDEKVDSIMYDENGKFLDYRISTDKKDLGDAIPDYFGSLSMNLTLFRHVNIYGLLDWQTGVKVYNFTKVYQTFFGNNVAYNEATALVDSLNAIDGYDYHSGKYKKAVKDYVKYDAVFYGSRAAFIENGDYLKIRELSISYDASHLLKKYLPNAGIERLAFSFTANNLITWTKYSGADPEVNSTGSTVDGGETYVTRNEDFLTMQHPKRIAFSIQLGL
ncbi:MAG: carboxypeptidase-like regulatory domain-containing protein [Candidatus Marinimicrobia bacterium]|nr:carboxypeptidase-like regulatory domain-containing protein [Candidatus Neomarinimicrobiota bacterium]